eukprot:scaffold8103_cov403-Prasinococcus_capsulatus_cf.AAC.3
MELRRMTCGDHCCWMFASASALDLPANADQEHRGAQHTYLPYALTGLGFASSLDIGDVPSNTWSVEMWMRSGLGVADAHSAGGNCSSSASTIC